MHCGQFDLDFGVRLLVFESIEYGSLKEYLNGKLKKLEALHEHHKILCNISIWLTIEIFILELF